MKKYYFIAILLMFELVSFGGIVINTTITIGKKSQNCTGFGICTLKKSIAYTDGSVNGTLEVDKQRGFMILSINKSDLLIVQPEMNVFFENKNSVAVTEDYVINDEINVAVHASDPLLIKKGEYVLSFRNGKYYIEIPL